MSDDIKTKDNQDDPIFHLNLRSSITATKPSSALGRVFAPTSASLKHPHDSVADLRWTSRAHRKRRYRLLDDRGNLQAKTQAGMKQKAETVWTKVARMGKLEWTEASWWVAVLFTFGSRVWVVNGFIVFLPQVNSNKYAENETGGGWTAWLGATIFEFGAIAALYEAMNRDESVDFGDDESHDDHPKDDSERALNTLDNNKSKLRTRKKRYFLPTNPALWREIGFLAGFVQIWAATIFWISGWTGIPQIFDPIKKKSTGLEDGVYWTPQVIGGSGFVIASLLYMLENQKRWWKPAPLSLGWHVGFWNFVGAVGFTLCGIFGYSRFAPAQEGANNWATLQSTCSTFWGGWAFLIGSLVQWWEAVQPATTNTDANSDYAKTNTNTNMKQDVGDIETAEIGEKGTNDGNIQP